MCYLVGPVQKSTVNYAITSHTQEQFHQRHSKFDIVLTPRKILNRPALRIAGPASRLSRFRRWKLARAPGLALCRRRRGRPGAHQRKPPQATEPNNETKRGPRGAAEAAGRVPGRGEAPAVPGPFTLVWGTSQRSTDGASSQRCRPARPGVPGRRGSCFQR